MGGVPAEVWRRHDARVACAGYRFKPRAKVARIDPPTPMCAGLEAITGIVKPGGLSRMY
jgi:hypothetical protein